jgi:hypothetical protein
MFRQFCFGLGIKHITTTPYYPQPSHAERFNRNLRSALIAFHSDSQTTWDRNLCWLQLAFNTATHESTGATPFQVMFPFRAGSPLLHQWGIENLPDSCTAGSIRGLLGSVRRNLFHSHEQGPDFDDMSSFFPCNLCVSLKYINSGDELLVTKM